MLSQLTKTLWYQCYLYCVSHRVQYQSYICYISALHAIRRLSLVQTFCCLFIKYILDRAEEQVWRLRAETGRPGLEIDPVKEAGPGQAEYYRTYLRCILISRFWDVEISLHFNLAFSQCSSSIYQAFDGRTEFLRVFNFAISSHLQNSRKLMHPKNMRYVMTDDYIQN